MDDRHIGLQTRLSREDVAGLIEALVESLKEGSIGIHKGGEDLDLDVPRVLDLDMEGGNKDGRAFFRVELSWLAVRPDVPDISMPEQRKKAVPESGALKRNGSGKNCAKKV